MESDGDVQLFIFQILERRVKMLTYRGCLYLDQIDDDSTIELEIFQKENENCALFHRILFESLISGIKRNGKITLPENYRSE